MIPPRLVDDPAPSRPALELPKAIMRCGGCGAMLDADGLHCDSGRADCGFGLSEQGDAP